MSKKNQSIVWLDSAQDTLDDIKKRLEDLTFSDHEQKILIEELKSRLKNISDINNKKYNNEVIRELTHIRDAENFARHQANNMWLSRTNR